MVLRNKTRKVSKRVLEMWDDPATVWGKNPQLEKFWGDLASQKKVVLIHKDGSSKYVSMPNWKTKKYQDLMAQFQEDKNIVAILSSNLSQDAYELYLYPKAKEKSVDYVIKNYKKFFKPISPGDKMRVPL